MARRDVLVAARVAVGAYALAACFSPKASPGAPCAADGSCPTGLACEANVCVIPGTTPTDGGPDDAALPAVDAAPPPPMWSTPLKLDTLETPDNAETDPSTSGDRLTVVLVAEVTSTDNDIYIATRTTPLSDTFTGLTNLTAINSVGFNDQAPELTADGLTIFFSSDRSGAYDIYTSSFAGGVWSVPAVRTDLSSGSADNEIAISPDGLTAAVVRSSTFYIYTRLQTTEPFGGATAHSELTGPSNLNAPTITNGGEVIYVHGGLPRQLYRSQLKGNGDYTQPELVTELNVAGLRTAAPFVSNAEDYMIFEVDGDIYESTR